MAKLDFQLQGLHAVILDLVGTEVAKLMRKCLVFLDLAKLKSKNYNNFIIWVFHF